MSPAAVTLPPRSRVRAVAGLLLLVLALAGCRLDVTAHAEVRADGSGRAAVQVTFDRALLAVLDDLAVDPTVELAVALERAPGWEMTRRSTDDDGLTVIVERDVADAQELTGTFRELVAGLTDDDPALVVDLAVMIDDEGAADLEGQLTFRPPAAPGLVGMPGAPDEQQLAAMTAATVTPTLQVTLPAAPIVHDADSVDGRTLTWVAPVGQQRTISARSPAPGIPLRALVLATAAILILFAIAGVALVTRRRAGSRR